MIRVLDPQIVNQIAAGEVIERPFSVVKELVENSLDAGATRISVEIAGGGTELIRITDDGSGFSPSDLELAFVSHATSKLGELADLDHIASLGFRGEALASVGSVSRAWIRSRQPGQEAGAEVRCEGGAISEVKPCGTPPGSIVEIRDLFHNTPARRRFLKSQRAEQARCKDLLVRLSLARLDVDFTLEVDGKQTLRLPGNEALRDRVGRTLGRALAGSMLEVGHETDRYRVEGVVADPDAARRDSTQELLYINGRLAKDRSVMFAVRQAYREHLVHGRYPAYVLHLSLPPDEVDVNVHPQKAEVRFARPRLAAGLLHEAVGRALRARHGAAGASLSIGADMPRARSGLPDLPRDLFARPDVPPSAPQFRTPAPMRDAAEVREFDAPPEPPKPNPFTCLQPQRFLQVHDLYLLFEGEDGFVVVDQHALHERILYERFRRRHDARGTRVQKLLVPEVVELAASDKEWLLEARDALAEEGFLIDDFGGDAVAVHGVPAVPGQTSPRKLVETFLLGDGDARPNAREAIVERFHSMACRAAVMSGDRLTEEEIRSMLEEAVTLEHPHNCPHGRPTVLSFTGGELERYFRRRV